ncbi:MAG: hypothetical protein LQ340_000670 [Diploschistes diacapsis]|nr:MAG: hypothetical protein LQ340_000670 [Diploschistes diacapsis]
MALSSRVLLIIGTILLAHACYSAQEFSSLAPNNRRSSNLPGSIESLALPAVTASSVTQLTALPLDIIIETLVSVALLCVAIVIGAEELKPINWRVWAGNIEKQRLERKSGADDLGKMREEGYEWLENGKRKGFLDIRGMRQDFAEWAKGNSLSSKA